MCIRDRHEIVFDAGKLAWIGYVAQTGAGDGLPTLTAQTFEALRTAGTTRLDAAVKKTIAPVAARERLPISSWFKICLDATGAITSANLVEGPIGAGAAFRSAIGDWKFKPFTVGGKPQPACSLTLLTYP